MSLYVIHAFGAVPAANVDAVNAHIEALKPADGTHYGPRNFSVPLNNDGSSKAPSHYGTHWAMTAAQFAQLSGDAKLQGLVVAWDTTNGKVGDKADGKLVDREKAWLATCALKRQVAADGAKTMAATQKG